MGVDVNEHPRSVMTNAEFHDKSHKAREYIDSVDESGHRFYGDDDYSDDGNRHRSVMCI
jgi:hypothetical protein